MEHVHAEILTISLLSIRCGGECDVMIKSLLVGFAHPFVLIKHAERCVSIWWFKHVHDNFGLTVPFFVPVDSLPLIS